MIISLSRGQHLRQMHHQELLSAKSKLLYRSRIAVKSRNTLQAVHWLRRWPGKMIPDQPAIYVEDESSNHTRGPSSTAINRAFPSLAHGPPHRAKRAMAEERNPPSTKVLPKSNISSPTADCRYKRCYDNGSKYCCRQSCHPPLQICTIVLGVLGQHPNSWTYLSHSSRVWSGPSIIYHTRIAP